MTRIVITLEVNETLSPNAIASALLALCSATAQGQLTPYSGYGTDLWMVMEYARSGALLPLPALVGINIRALGERKERTDDNRNITPTDSSG